jgi:hypothetical protein
VRRLDDDGDTNGCDLFSNRVGDLIGEPLLHLQAPAEDIDQARDLAEANHLRARNIRDMAPAEERQEMVLAEAVEVDVLDDHHFAVINREKRVVQHLVDVGRVSARQELERVLDPLGSVDQAFPIGVLPEAGEQLAD